MNNDEEINVIIKNEVDKTSIIKLKNKSEVKNGNSESHCAQRDDF